MLYMLRNIKYEKIVRYKVPRKKRSFEVGCAITNIIKRVLIIAYLLVYCFNCVSFEQEHIYNPIFTL